MSGILLLVRRSLRQHLLSTVVTMVSIALAVGLSMSIFNVHAQAHKAFTGGQTGFDAVLGAKGSHLQLVLNAVFHLETSPGNIAWKYYQAVKNDRRVQLAVPLAVGDNYHGFRIVGTSEEMFTKFEYQEGKQFKIAQGERFFDTRRYEAVVGSFAAQQTGLQVGSVFNPFHGLYFDPKMKHTEEYVVTAVLEPTNTPADRVIWIPIDGVFRMEGHTLRGSGAEYNVKRGESIPDEHKEVSAVLVKFKSEELGKLMADDINLRSKEITMAYPIGSVMGTLFDKLGWAVKILELVAYLVVVVAAGSILASIYNTMNERRREFAILRALGARRFTVFSAIVAEAGAIAFLGSLFGFVVYAAILSGAAAVIRSQTGVALEVVQGHPSLWITPLAMTVLGALAGIVPAVKAYSTDVAQGLTQ
jgi:putative ABC transport system permease protein